VFDVGAVRRLIQEDQAYGRALWGVLQLERWYEQFIDRVPAVARQQEKSANAFVVHQ
jgi:hypothetical protein